MSRFLTSVGGVYLKLALAKLIYNEKSLNFNIKRIRYLNSRNCLMKDCKLGCFDVNLLLSSCI